MEDYWGGANNGGEATAPAQDVMRSKPERSEMLKTSDFPVVRVAEKYLLNHIDI
jgi:hypothetical protein